VADFGGPKVLPTERRMPGTWEVPRAAVGKEGAAAPVCAEGPHGPGNTAASSAAFSAASFQQSPPETPRVPGARRKGEERVT